MALAVSGLSPVIITVRMPIRRSSSNRSRMPFLTMSLRWTTPRTRAPSAAELGHHERRTAAAGDGVDHRAEVGRWGAAVLADPLADGAGRRPCGRSGTRPFSARSQPLIRVWALNGTNVAWVSSPGVRSRRPYSRLARTTIERPSGVSSARLDSCAASASSAASTPSSGSSSTASRLPSVIVPVLSSSSVFTSPAASTARPDIASTLRCTSRSMPAMPIALSSAPIVVGIRQTSSETSTIPDCGAPLKIASGCSVTTASRKMMVRLASRMLSAISLGVFCRAAPSTRAIIRSRKVSPGFAVIRTTIRSESTRVPPVTADRSPPASRITGADSPVIADSSTLAMPSIDVAVAGDQVAGLAHDAVVDLEVGGGHQALSAVGEQPGVGLLAAAAQRRGLGLAPALGHGLGEVGEHDGGPQPDHDQPGEDRGVDDGEHGGQRRAHLDHEHHRVAHHGARVELGAGRRELGDQHPGVEQAGADPGGARGASGASVWVVIG